MKKGFFLGGSSKSTENRSLNQNYTTNKATNKNEDSDDDLPDLISSESDSDKEQKNTEKLVNHSPTGFPFSAPFVPAPAKPEVAETENTQNSTVGKRRKVKAKKKKKSQSQQTIPSTSITKETTKSHNVSDDDMPALVSSSDDDDVIVAPPVNVKFNQVKDSFNAPANSDQDKSINNKNNNNNKNNTATTNSTGTTTKNSNNTTTIPNTANITPSNISVMDLPELISSEDDINVTSYAKLEELPTLDIRSTVPSFPPKFTQTTPIATTTTNIVTNITPTPTIANNVDINTNKNTLNDTNTTTTTTTDNKNININTIPQQQKSNKITTKNNKTVNKGTPPPLVSTSSSDDDDSFSDNSNNNNNINDDDDDSMPSLLSSSDEDDDDDNYKYNNNKNNKNNYNNNKHVSNNNDSDDEMPPLVSSDSEDSSNEIINKNKEINVNSDKKLNEDLEQLLDQTIEDINVHKIPITIIEPPITMDVLNRAEEYKKIANDLLQDEQYEMAVEYYTKAIECNKNNAIYYANRCLAHLKWSNYGIGIADATKAITIEPEYVKAYWRRGCCYMALEQYRDALRDFKQVCLLDGSDKLAFKKVDDCERKLRATAFKNALSSQQQQTTITTNKNQQEYGKPGFGVPYWISPGVPKLYYQAAKVVAQEVSNNFKQYEDTLKLIPTEFLKYIVQFIPWHIFETIRQHVNYKNNPSFNVTLKYDVLKLEENYYRKLFAVNRENNILRDDYLQLIDVFECPELFQFESEPNDMKGIPKMFDFNPIRTSGSSIGTKEQFYTNLNTFSSGQLKEMDWNNVFLAGGSVLACLQPTPSIDLIEYFHRSPYKCSDLDLFIYGLNVHDANLKLIQIYDAIRRSTNGKLVAFRTLHTITIASDFPLRHIQIVLRLYKSPAEILMGFDIDSCAVGFDGFRVWCHPRAARALKYQFNLIDLSRRSPSYELRMYKYTKRGFRVAVPGLDRSRINPKLIGRDTTFFVNRLKGLAKLIWLERKQRERNNGTHELYVAANKYDKEKNEIIEEEKRNSEEVSDYATVYFPYGPNYSVNALKGLVHEVHYRINNYYIRVVQSHPARGESTVCLYGTMEEVLKGKISTGIPEKRVWSEEDGMHVQKLKHVSAEESWVTDNPGKQGYLTGSFHPIVASKADWEDKAYS